MTERNEAMVLLHSEDFRMGVESGPKYDLKTTAEVVSEQKDEANKLNEAILMGRRSVLTHSGVDCQDKIPLDRKIRRSSRLHPVKSDS